MSFIDNLEIKIYPLILESPLVATHFWHLIRAIDEQGSGKVSFTLNELKEILGVSKSSIYKYLNSELFLKVVKHKNKLINERVYTIYYKSLKQVKELLGLENLITASFCEWSSIKSFMDKRRTATEVIAESIQARSFYKARIDKKETQHLLNIDNLFVEGKSSISDNTQGIKHTSFGIFYDRAIYQPYGASQQTIANTIGRSRQTVNKRLKNKPKLQQFVKGELTKAKYSEQRFYDSESGETNFISKYFISFGDIYERYTNIYKPEYQLKRKTIKYA